MGDYCRCYDAQKGKYTGLDFLTRVEWTIRTKIKSQQLTTKHAGAFRMEESRKKRKEKKKIRIIALSMHGLCCARPPDYT